MGGGGRGETLLGFVDLDPPARPGKTDARRCSKLPINIRYCVIVVLYTSIYVSMYLYSAAVVSDKKTSLEKRNENNITAANDDVM